MKTHPLLSSVVAAALTISVTSAEEFKYRIATKIVQLQNLESVNELYSESSLSEAETLMIFRKLSKMDNAMIQTLPSIITDLNDSITLQDIPTVDSLRAGETPKGKPKNDITFKLNVADGDKLKGSLTILDHKTSEALSKAITKKQGDQKTYWFDTNFDLGDTLIIKDCKTLYFIVINKIMAKGEPIRS